MSDTADRVKKIVVEHLGVEADKVTEDASFLDDLGADSLDIVELVMAFEEEFKEEIKGDTSNKANFKQKKEFEQLQEDIAALEEEKEKLVASISQGTDDHEALLAWSTRVQEIDQQLETLESRWLELSELEGIE